MLFQRIQLSLSVPQGSRLGSLQFSMYISNVSESQNLIMYVGNTNAFLTAMFATELEWVILLFRKARCVAKKYEMASNLVKNLIYYF